MNKYEIKQLAIECGFKLKQQPDGGMDLNPYVYQFAERLLSVKESSDLDAMFGAFDGITVEGGVCTDNDEGCEGGACKI